jgi:Concanavalin A-like lectin/glucanases superfamily
MKKHQLKSPPRAKKAACSVSAAALMLGVSHAATVGFNFQANYCSAASYSGSPVTAPAFGIGTNSWESLTPMDTGYGCAPGPFTLNEVIDTTSAPGTGLNPLPNGSLAVTWSGYVANVSGFAGYGPHFGANGYHPGEQQVYWGFIRDGVNFGPGSTGGDNNQPGYSVDIVGLKSVFTNSPFVVQLVASSDSLDTLTNAFIIDASVSSTQSVTYPNIAPVSNVGDTAWIRGIGGGLSTASGPVTTDHLKIVGNRAEHVANPGGFNRASTIAGFILTDKPVVTMPPQPALATPGDNVTLRSIAIGVPPLSLQWRQNGAAIPGATNLTYAITNIGTLQGGKYDLLATNLYGSTTGAVAMVTVDQLAVTPRPIAVDAKPSGVPQDGAIFGATWLASSQDSRGTTRTGFMQFVGAQAAQIRVAATLTNFDSPQGSIMFWMRSSGTLTNFGTQGAVLFDRLAGSGLILVQQDDGTLLVQPSGAGGNKFTSTATSLSDNNWHHIAVTYDQADTGSVSLYVDGNLDTANPNAGAWSWPVGQEIELGRSHNSAFDPYNGLMDDFRVYNRVLTAAEITTVHGTGAVVDAGAMQVMLNFDTPPAAGITISWQSPSATLQSADVANGPFTDVSSVVSPYSVRSQSAQKFYRYRHTPASIITNPYDM